MTTRRDDAPGWRQRSDRLAVTPRDQRDERVGSRLTRIWAGLYTGPRMGVDTVQPSRHLAHPTTDYPTTRLPDYPTTASRAAADLAAPVLTAAPLMRVAHSRHASARPTADHVGRKLPVHTNRLSGACICTCMPARNRQLPSGIWQGTLCPKKGGEDDTERAARARGVSPGEPGESLAARF